MGACLGDWPCLPWNSSFCDTTSCAEAARPCWSRVPKEAEICRISDRYRSSHPQPFWKQAKDSATFTMWLSAGTAFLFSPLIDIFFFLGDCDSACAFVVNTRGYRTYGNYAELWTDIRSSIPQFCAPFLWNFHNTCSVSETLLSPCLVWPPAFRVLSFDWLAMDLSDCFSPLLLFGVLVLRLEF